MVMALSHWSSSVFLACQLSFNNDRERAASSIHSSKQVFELDPVLHPIGGRIVFNRKCADETLDHVQAYAKMGSQDGRAQAVVASALGTVSQAKDRESMCVWI